MASIINDLVVPAFKGRLGRVVFRHLGGKVYAALKPTPTVQPPSPAQEAHRIRFREARAFAKSAMANPAQRQVYERVSLQKRIAPFSLAIGDFFHPPAVSKIYLDAYKGLVGQKIVVMAIDDVEVASVTVVIRNSAGAIVEQGTAVFEFELWHYTATTTLATGASVTIEVTAKDNANNAATGSLPYHQP